MIYNTTSLVYIFNARCSRSVEHSIILLSSSNKSSDTDDTDKSFSILRNQNVAISRHKPSETNNLADHHKVATHTTTTSGPSSSVILNLPECLNQPMHF